jgi:HSP20 family protein
MTRETWKLKLFIYGCKERNIELKMVEYSFFIEQKRKKQESNRWNLCILHGFVPEKAVAKYCDGKLYVAVSSREATETVDIKIQ